MEEKPLDSNELEGRRETVIPTIGLVRSCREPAASGHLLAVGVRGRDHPSQPRVLGPPQRIPSGQANLAWFKYIQICLVQLMAR